MLMLTKEIKRQKIYGELSGDSGNLLNDDNTSVAYRIALMKANTRFFSFTYK